MNCYRCGSQLHFIEPVTDNQGRLWFKNKCEPCNITVYSGVKGTVKVNED